MARFVVSPDQSQLDVDGKSSLHPIHGQAKGMSGFFEADVANGALAATPPPAMELTIPVANLTSGNDLEDNQMHNLIGGPRYPNIKATLKDLTPLGQPNRYAVHGEITVRGQSKVYDGEVTCTIDGSQLTLDGQREFDIRDFGIQPPKILFLQVYPQVTVRLHLVATSEG